MRVIRRNGNAVISLPLLDEPELSTTGKSFLIATSRGMWKSKLKQDGSNLFYTASVFSSRSQSQGRTQATRRNAARNGRRPQRSGPQEDKKVASGFGLYKS